MKKLLKIILVIVLIVEVFNIYVYSKSIQFSSDDIEEAVNKLNPESYSNEEAFLSVHLSNLRRDIIVSTSNIDRSINIINYLMVAFLLTVLSLYVVSAKRSLLIE